MNHNNTLLRKLARAKLNREINKAELNSLSYTKIKHGVSYNNNLSKIEKLMK